MPLCFAYGSNMDRAAMAERCPSSRPLAPARLPRHRFAILPEGFATVLPDPRRGVWGVLWDVALSDMPALDRYEGVTENLYRKAFLPVLTGDGARRALVYLGCSRGEGRAMPGYLEGVVAAARAAGLPEPYIREIGADLPAGCAPAGGAPPRPAVRPLRRTPLDPMPAGRAILARWSP